MHFNKGQERGLKILGDFYYSNELVIEYGGLPGTGKTTLLMEFIRRHNIPLSRVAPMTYVGQASLVLRSKGFTNAKTIHSWNYEPVETPLKVNGEIVMDTYMNKPKMVTTFVPVKIDNMDLLVIDEGRMVPDSMKDHIEKHNIKTIVCGDPGQLPPVFGKPAYLNNPAFVLDEIMRQEAHSAKLYLADRARKGLPIHKGFYGDVYVIDEDELNHDMVVNSDIVICGTNKTRNNINDYVRKSVFRTDSDLPLRGEKMVCRKNNWKIGIGGINLTNGMRGTILNHPDVAGFNGNTYSIDFMPDMLDTLYFENLLCDYHYLNGSLDKRKEIKQSKYYKGEKMEFGYAITTHLSQGSEYMNGVYIEEVFDTSIHSNLLNTGITRFKGNLIFVKQKRKYY